MPKTYEKRIVAILFADLVGFSKLDGDTYATAVADLLDELRRRYLSEGNHFLWKTWGDGVLIAAYDPVDLADVALEIRDYFRNKNWQQAGFPLPLQIRIGIHLERTEIAFEGSAAVDVHGNSVNSAARIEPVAAPNTIYCSEPFYRHVLSDGQASYGWRDLGVQELAKGFGHMQLLELLRPSEIASTPTQRTVSTPDRERAADALVPRIRRDFSDRERADFAEAGFQEVRAYFQSAISSLESSDPEAEARLREYPDRLSCAVYFRGNERASCNIWLHHERGSSEIRYSHGHGYSQNSFNNSLHVTDDGFTLSWKCLFGLMHGATEECVTTQKAAEVLWEQFTQTLLW